MYFLLTIMVVFTYMYHLGKVTRGGEVGDLMFDLLSNYCALLKVQTAKLALRRLKTLRHPNILRYIDALEVGIKEMFSLMTLSLDSYLMLQLHPHVQTNLSLNSISTGRYFSNPLQVKTILIFWQVKSYTYSWFLLQIF